MWKNNSKALRLQKPHKDRGEKRTVPKRKISVMKFLDELAHES